MIAKLYGLLADHIDGAPRVDGAYRLLITLGEGKFAK